MDKLTQIIGVRLKILDVEQLDKRNLQSTANLFQDSNGRIGFTSLHITKVLDGKARLLRQFFLSHISAFPQESQMVTKSSLQVVHQAPP
jgi:hypothetical protein